MLGISVTYWLLGALAVAFLAVLLMLPIPLSYNYRSVRARWTSAIVAVLGIAGTVGVFVAMLSLARGFKTTLVSSGSGDNAIIMRAGATSELTGGVELDKVKIINDAPGIARGSEGPLVTPEIVIVAPIPLISTGTDANVQLRGVSKNVLEIRRNIKIVEGRLFTPGLAELIVGKNAMKSYAGLHVGKSIRLGTVDWNIVGMFDAGGTSFDSELWMDAKLLGPAYGRGVSYFQSVTAHLESPAALQKLRDALTTDPRLNVDVTREVDYYTKQSGRLTTLITVLGGLVAAVMAIGAVFGALNTMYSAVAERGREIATMRAIGFGGPSVVFSFMVEALLIAFVGGLIGCVSVLKLNGVTTGAMNLQTFSHVAFAFLITPELLAKGILFALAMGIVGGLLPAVRAALQPVATALRSL